MICRPSKSQLPKPLGVTVEVGSMLKVSTPPASVRTETPHFFASAAAGPFDFAGEFRPVLNVMQTGVHGIPFSSFKVISNDEGFCFKRVMVDLQCGHGIFFPSA